MALDTLFWRVSGTIMGTVLPHRSVVGLRPPTPRVLASDHGRNVRAQYGFALSSCILKTSRAVGTGGGDSMTTRTFTIQLPTDGNGLVGRQCTKNDCNKYFKVKPGTGLSKPTQAFCPYCGQR